MYSVAISLVHKDNDRKLEFALPQKFVRTPTALQMMNIYATRDSTLDSDNNLQPTSTLPQSAPTDCRMQTAQNSQ